MWLKQAMESANKINYSKSAQWHRELMGEFGRKHKREVERIKEDNHS